VPRRRCVPNDPFARRRRTLAAGEHCVREVVVVGVARVFGGVVDVRPSDQRPRARFGALFLGRGGCRPLRPCGQTSKAPFIPGVATARGGVGSGKKVKAETTPLLIAQASNHAPRRHR
jgi:hypothetical protein